jgi:hypothetical protein
MNIELLLQEIRTADFYIREERDVPDGRQVRLGCGATITVYQRGTILVQGKFIASARDESIAMLKAILPPHARWHTC